MKLNKLLTPAQIMLDVEVKNQEEALKLIAHAAKEQGYITDEEKLVTTFLNREAVSSTGFEDGIALPHAQNDDIIKPKIFIVRTKKGIEWNAVDGQLTNFIIAIIIPKDQVSDLHLDVISSLSLKLVDENLRKTIKTVTDKNQLIQLFSSQEPLTSEEQDVSKTNEPKQKIVGISSCTTGVVHTYMCKELLEKAGKDLGYKIKIECQGQKGPEFILSDKEIKEADVVILATDVAVELDRFMGKRIYQTGTKPVVKDAKWIIDLALKTTEVHGTVSTGKENKGDFILSASKGRKGILKHLLSGVSFMIPFVVFAGLIFAVTTGIAKGVFGPNFGLPTNWSSFDKQGFSQGNLNLIYILMVINNIANIGFNLMIPIMGAYIAYSIAGRAGIAPAMIVTFILISPPGVEIAGIPNTVPDLWWNWGGIFNLHGNSHINANLPFLGNSNISWTLFGALFGGLTCGYLVKYVNSWKVPKWLAPIMPIIIIPVFCTAIVAIPTAFFLAAPFGYVMGALDYGLSWLGLPSHASIGFLVGLILGAMVGFDMGGPINKVAVLVATSLMGLDGGRLMGPVAAAIPIAPLGCALTATVLGRKMFSKEEKSLGVNAWLLGFMGISESAIPFAARDTWRVIVPNIIGSAVAGALAFTFNVAGHVGAWGSFIIALFGGVTDTSGSYIGILWYIIAICVGTSVHSVIYTSLLLAKSGNFQEAFQKVWNKISFKKDKKIIKKEIEL